MPSIDGLASGLNTSEIIASLMQLERRGQVRLQNEQRQTQSAISALRTLNSAFLAVGTGAKPFTSGTGWTLMSTSSSDPTRATATVSAGSAAGEVTFAVKQLATSETWKTSGTVASVNDVVVTPGSTVTVTKDGVATQVATGDGTLGALAKALTGAGAGISATAVQVSPGAFALQVTSATTGSTGIALTDPNGADPFAAGGLTALGLITDGADARLQVGVAPDGSGGYEVTRKTNTFSDLLTGTTISLLKQDPAAVVTVRSASDTAAVADSAAKMIDAVNAALGEIAKTGSYDATTKKAGVLYGEGAVRSLRSALATAVTGSSPTTSPGMVGISVQRDGTVAFDRAKFLAALEKDPAAVHAAVGVDGLAGRLAAVSDGASRGAGAAGGPGVLTAAITSRERSVTALQGDIGKWDQRLELRQQRLVAQFTALEKALSAAQSQGQWLAGQIAGLPRHGG